ncbi:tetratricopeptide repeat protein [Prosthecobacter fusiformis]|uniref:Tetratricopeptide repeat protein n=1 Tax=Prosthecobacter fusiformis TaxID=48464 RepID=A0A4R7RSH8_9BACT|nr:tetratricopeptide repeat protein [Prosthecobacter fusiformis]TDU68089.1 tetratricopeptide repeat protein [Prosthecobacter fusiformis]
MIVTASELQPKHQNLWKRGQLSIEQKNWDYAVSLLLPIVKDLPYFLEGRKWLRLAEGEASGGGRKFSFGGGMFKGGSKKDPLEAIAELEENVFQKDPYNVSANQQLYDLALKLEFPELAAFALETICKGQPTNTKVMHTLAEHFMTHDEPGKASAVYAEIRKLDPRDLNAAKGEKDAAARNSIKTQGWGTGNIKDSQKDNAEANLLDLLGKQGRTLEQTESLLAHFTGLYNQDQTNINYVKSMAQLYEELEQTDNALSFYEYALTLNPGDVALQRRTELIREKAQDVYIQQMAAHIEAHPDAPDIEEKRAELAEVKKQRSLGAINESKARVERNPTDKAVRFDLGQAYFNAGMFTEAIPELQQAKSNPNIRIKAILMLGRCFEKKNMNDLAHSAFAEASKELAIMDNTKKEILYELALVSEKMGKQDQYLEALKEIYNADYGYRDVAKRVESSYN